MFRDNIEVADSTVRSQRETSALSSDADLSQYSTLVGNGKKLDTDKLGLAGDNELLMALNAQPEAASESGLDSQSQEIAKLLKGASPEDAAEAFADYMEENKDAMYEEANAANPDDPLGYIADKLNKAFEGTGYTAFGDKKAEEISLWKDGDFLGGVQVGPTLEDMLGIPKN
ncbi:MAG: hypothetical protein DKT66_00335 [Candidatus Melainabacteria bacterium]|nr:MAG: hypothetical protein DKT66_00335 [Candidatus Melainabacteria bacterium]